MGFGYNGSSLKDLWRYNPTDNSWNKMTDCPVTLNSPSSFRLGNLGYFGFGWDIPLLYSFDPALNQWTKKNDFTDLSLDNSNRGAQFAFNIGEKAYMIAARPNSFWEYDQQNDTWIRKNGYSNLQGPLSGNHFAGSDGSIVLFHPEYENSPGQFNSVSSTSKLLLFDPSGFTSPANLRIAESSKKTIKLKWFHDEGDVKFMIERWDYAQYAWKIIDSTGMNVKIYTDTTIKENVFYKYLIYAKSIIKKSDYSNEVFFRSGPPGLVNVNRVLSKFKENNLTIFFNPENTNFADGYYLERSDELNPTVFVPIDTFDYKLTSIMDKNLEKGKWYSYRIKSYNKFGTTISKSVRGRAGDVCFFNGNIKTDNVTIIDEFGYDVEYYHCSNSKLTIYPETSGNKINVTIDELGIYTNDTIYIYNGPSVASPLLGKFTGKTVPDKLFCGNNPDGCLTIYFKANCSWSGTDFSGFKSTATSNKYFPPSGLKAVPAINNIKLNWTDNSTNEDYFIIERSVGDKDHFIKLDSVSANIASYSELNTSSTQHYFYRVRLKSGNEYSGYSNVHETMLLPASPSELAIKVNPDGNLKLKWTDNANNESRYLIYRSYNDSLHFSIIDTVLTDVDSFKYIPQKDVLYYYQIRAGNMGGLSGGTISKPFIFLKTPGLAEIYGNEINSLFISWYDNSYMESGYKIER